MTDRNGERQQPDTGPAERYLTDDLPGIGGVIKQHVKDFRVEELPLYQPA